jgi:uncharacterized protein DUF6152
VQIVQSGSLPVIAVGLGLLLSTSSAFAHHSFAADYDANKPFTVIGTVTRIDWTNPHAFFYVDVKDADGNVTNWEFEMGSPNGLTRRGWNRDTVKVGDTITVYAYHAKDGSHLANARKVKLSDGRIIFTVLPDGGGPPR